MRTENPGLHNWRLLTDNLRREHYQRRLCCENQRRARLPKIQAGTTSAEVATTSEPSDTKNWRGPRVAYPARIRSVSEELSSHGSVADAIRTVINHEGQTKHDATLDEAAVSCVSNARRGRKDPYSHDKRKGVTCTFAHGVRHVADTRDGSSADADVQDGDELQKRVSLGARNEMAVRVG